MMPDPAHTDGSPAHDLAIGVAKSTTLLTEALARQHAEFSPLRIGLSPTEQAAHRARIVEANRQREREVQAAHEAALADWNATRALLKDNRPALAVLDVHQPCAGYHRVECVECEESDGYESTAQVEWPCRTYTAIKQTVTGLGVEVRDA